MCSDPATPPAPPIAITLGDPAGIGPEVLVKAAAALSGAQLENGTLFGEAWIWEQTARSLFSGEPPVLEKLSRLKIHSLNRLKPGDFEMGKLSSKTGDAAYRYFTEAVRECRKGSFRALVTAPLNKEGLHLAGHHFLGHTDILEKITGTPLVMSIFHPQLIVGHVTDHLPLRKALDAITPNRVLFSVRCTANAARQFLGRPPRIAVAGINPHAGENGILGDDEKKILEPALRQLKKEGFDVVGPLPGDTIFYEALNNNVGGDNAGSENAGPNKVGRYDVVMAMYHDQGFGPMKTLDLNHGVNCSLGLSFARTSPDHGTAYNIAGKNRADATSTLEAWKLAIRLAAAKSPPHGGTGESRGWESVGWSPP